MLFSPFDPENLNDPLPMYAKLRQEGPYIWHDLLNSWLCTRYADCLEVIKESSIFASDPRRVGVEVPMAMQSIQTLDPPEQSELRRALARMFRNQDMIAAERHARDTLDDILDQLAGKPVVDLVHEVAGPLALKVVTNFLGLASLDYDTFANISERLVKGMDFGWFPDAFQPAMQARQEISDLIDGQLRDIEGEAGFASQLLAESPGADRVTIVNSLRVLLHAGYSSVSRFLENAMLALVNDPQLQTEFAAIRGDEALSIAVNELIRFDGPVQAEARFVARDIIRHGVEMQKGQIVIMILGSANNDEAVFSQPARLNLTRSSNPHLAFGRGVHSCLGAGLALTQAKVVLPRIFGDAHALVTPAGNWSRRINASLRGVATLPVELSGRR